MENINYNFENFWKSLQETKNILDEKFQMLAEEHKKTESSIASLSEENKKTEKMIKELSLNIGGLNNSFGDFTESIFLNSIEKILRDNFQVQFFDRNIDRQNDKSGVEIDGLGLVNGTKNFAYITEIKTKFSKKSIDQLEKTLNKFNEFFPEHSNKTKYGVLAVMSLKEDQKKEILKAGFYPITLENELAKLDIPKDFKPKAFN